MAASWITGTCGGISQALGDPACSGRSLAVGLLIGFVLTLPLWRRIILTLTGEYRRLRHRENHHNQDV